MIIQRQTHTQYLIDQLVQLLQANDVDVAVMGRPPKELATRAEPFAAHPHVFVAPVDHPLVKQGGAPTVESLRPYGFIMRERSCSRRRRRPSAISCWSAATRTSRST